ncbi:IclR family transcriptional regulator [Alicyclobacillus tolerans]|uniref:IclR family transcriptional regulator n=1 Tax=Alicyclobacillus tolerans TaxID=90970 RepID=UPI001F25E49C|nr:IclR family transcriptional regulator [Alicyclobacillus tolerans]MCF8568340.1 IclR family transcriptional regulator [Alicyclobacillus tolerans]
MEKKYWVPAIERANAILNMIAMEPSRLRLIDISKRLEINKSSIFSLLNTLEILGWITKEKGDTYSLGPSLGSLSAAYFRQFNILQSFYIEAEQSLSKINEHIQFGILDGANVLYLAKIEGPSHVRLITDPGMRFPAYATAIGKVQMVEYEYEHIQNLYGNSDLEPKTPYTVRTVSELWNQVQQIKKAGYAKECQESALGFYCVAAAVRNHEGKIIAAVSFTMQEENWKEKEETACLEIKDLAYRLSMHAGYTPSLPGIQ